MIRNPPAVGHKVRLRSDAVMASHAYDEAVSRVADLGRRLTARRWALFDLGVATALVLATAQSPHGGLWWLAAAPMVAGVLVRRPRPMLAVGLTGVGAVLHHLDTSVGFAPLDLAFPLAIYTLAASEHPRRRSLIVVGLAVTAVAALSLLHVLTAPTPDFDAGTTPGVAKSDLLRGAQAQKKTANPDAFTEPKPFAPTKPEQGDGSSSAVGILSDTVSAGIGVALVLGLAFAVGDGVRSRRAHLRTLETRAADLEREQQQRVALATAAERARITRELHDVVAHGLSVMVVQAQGGAAALHRHPERTADALQNVIATGRASLAEMRRLLDVVRHNPVDDVQLAPQPGVSSLPDLVDRVRAAGTPVTFTVEGDPVALPVTTDLSVYRIAQEALTNTIKHAGGASAVVRLGFTADRLEIEVTDDGTSSRHPDGEGNGLRGIAERTALLGGEFTAGPLEAGGFQVRAVLPLDADRDVDGVAG